MDTTKQLHFHFSLSCIGEGNGNPLQCSCLENPRDRGAWRAAVYGVAHSWTGLKRLSSSSTGRKPPNSDYSNLFVRFFFFFCISHKPLGIKENSSLIITGDNYVDRPRWSLDTACLAYSGWRRHVLSCLGFSSRHVSIMCLCCQSLVW